jgi:hypothetical protein
MCVTPFAIVKLTTHGGVTPALKGGIFLLNNYFLPIDLSMFDGSGAADGSSTVAGQNISGETSANPAAEGEHAANTAATDRESKRKAFRELINGEYKTEHDEIFNRRFKDHKQLERYKSETQTLIDTLHTRYGTNGDNKALMAAFNGDSYFWGGVAEERGGTEDSARKQLAMESELRQYKIREQTERWNAEIAALQEKYPDFDIDAEMADPDFRAMLKNNMSLESVYRTRHMDEFIRQAAASAAADAERRVTESIRAKGQRPDENGVQSGAGYVAKVDVSKLTREQRRELAEKAMRGEHIEL